MFPDLAVPCRHALILQILYDELAFIVSTERRNKGSVDVGKLRQQRQNLLHSCDSPRTWIERDEHETYEIRRSSTTLLD